MYLPAIELDDQPTGAKMNQFTGQAAIKSSTWSSAVAQEESVSSSFPFWLIGGMALGFVIGQIATGGKLSGLFKPGLKPIVGAFAIGGLGIGYLAYQTQENAALAAVQQNIGSK